jgi:RimJ/RimL family protein N-acetyltransferase
VTVVLRSADSVHGIALVLRPWGAEDITCLLDIYRDPLMRQSSRNPVRTEPDAWRWLEAKQRGWSDGSRRSFAVLEDCGDEPCRVLGNVVLKGCSAGKDVAEVGYWTAVAARNRGIASQAVETLTSWAFESFGPVGLRRIELLHQVDNAASCRVAVKTGYALINVLPAEPPAHPAAGHLHARYSPGGP